MIKNNLPAFILLVVFFFSGIAYLVYLNESCNELGGVMTSHGKVCVEDLNK